MKLCVATTVAIAISAVSGRALDPRDPFSNGSSLATSPGVPDILINRSIPSPKVHAFDPNNRASPEVWDKYVLKGGALNCASRINDRDAGIMLGDDRNPPSAASRWSGNPGDLTTWFWHEDDDEEEIPSCDFNDERHMKRIMDALQLNGAPYESGGNNECYSILHGDPYGKEKTYNQVYEALGKRYRATSASYNFGVNRKDGAIYVDSSFSPATRAEALWGYKPNKLELPYLRSLSDIMWYYWTGEDNPNIRNIRYFFVIEVVNQLTRRLMETALSRVGINRYATWPGVTFSIDSDEGKAILGSPNGAAFAYFLIQRKAQLGDKHIQSVTIFLADNGESPDNSGNNPNLMFKVEDGPGQ